jgi:hypothetical protein
MKTKLLFLSFFASLISFAQSPIPTFYGANNSSFSTLTTGTAINHGAGGANQTWTFDQLIPLGTSVHTNVTPTAGEVSSYPGTTTVINTASTVGTTTSTSKLYTKFPSNVLSITGLNSSGLVANFNTNNASLGTFPVNYGYTNTDSNVAGNYTYTTYAGTFSGTLVTTVDAYGTLNLNDFGTGAYTGSVTRLKTVLNISLNYGIIPNVGTITQTSYSYYDATIGSNNPIFRSTVTTSVVALAGINQTDTSLEKFETVLLENPNRELATVWIKNPVENTVEINAPDAIDGALISVTDVLGKTIYQTKNENLQGVLELPISLTKGVYLVNISNYKGSVTKKIIKN